MIEYIVGHYAWFLGAIVLILLAVLGYYADKTSFGQKKIDKKNKKGDAVKVEPTEEKFETSDIEMTNADLDKPSTLNANEEIIKEEFESSSEIQVPSEIDKIEEAEDSFNKLSEQIDSLLPERDVINIDLLEDIDELELGKTRKIDINLVPDLDDIDLPKIKNLVDEEQDVWKF